MKFILLTEDGMFEPPVVFAVAVDVAIRELLAAIRSEEDDFLVLDVEEAMDRLHGAVVSMFAPEYRLLVFGPVREVLLRRLTLSRMRRACLARN